MRHDETRDNTTDIEATIIEADNRDMTPVDMDNPTEGWFFDAVVTREDDGANGYDEGSVAEALFGEKHFGGDGDDIEEDDSQPSEYEEWQDYMGGDEYYDHSENEMW